MFSVSVSSGHERGCCVSSEKLGKLNESEGRIDSRAINGDDGAVEEFRDSVTCCEELEVFIVISSKNVFYRI